MTREEFEYAIKSCGCFIYRGQIYYEESELIKAFEDLGLIHIGLDQEPSGDLISRQAVMDCFKKWQPYMATRLWDFEQELSALPSISPQPCEDAISRQAVINAIYDMEILKYRIDLENVIKALPSVKPQEPSITWVTGADGAKIAFWDVPVGKVTKICEILIEPQERSE